MQVLCWQPCNATRIIQTTLTGHSLATQLNWNGSIELEFSSNLNQTHLSMSSSLENHRWVSLIKVGAKLCRKVDLMSHIWGVTDMSLLTRAVFHSTFRHALANFPKHFPLGESPLPFWSAFHFVKWTREIYMDRPSTPRFWPREQVCFICTLQAPPQTTMQHNCKVIADHV